MHASLRCHPLARLYVHLPPHPPLFSWRPWGDVYVRSPYLASRHVTPTPPARPINVTQEIEKLTGTEADDGEEDISMMMLPDYSSGNNEKDIHVKNFNINVGGLELLDCADLKLAYGRKVCVFAQVVFVFVCFTRLEFVLVFAGARVP